VTAFRRAIGAASVPWTDKVLGYPRAFVEETPEAAVLVACGVTGIVRSAELRARWGWAGTAALAVVAFLIAGDLGDGAPTHHPARALASTWWIAIGMGADAVAALVAHMRPVFAGFARGRGDRGDRDLGAAEGPQKPQNGSLIVSLLTILVVSSGLAWGLGLPGRWAQVPGATDWERREAQIARGLDLRAQDVASVDITPCQFEQFALLAAWGQPERAHVNPRTQGPITGDCPRVVVPAGPP
jgi:hypothetical protein